MRGGRGKRGEGRGKREEGRGKRGGIFGSCDPSTAIIAVVNFAFGVYNRHISG
jgi:hypothetical protein